MEREDMSETLTLDQASSASREVQDFLKKQGALLIGGEARDAAEGRTFATLDPSTGRELNRIAEATAADVDEAVKSARAALTGSWAQVSPAERGRILTRLADLIERDADHLAQLESLDNGAPLAFTKAVFIPLAADHFRYFAGWATKISGSTVNTAFPNTAVTLEREPIGVVGAIVPWNFPLTIASWKVAPALAAGCTVVLKPAEQTPLTALWLGKLALEAGLPPGVLNIVTGDGEAGRALVTHPDIDKIAFTGSLEVGKEIRRESAGTLKRVSLELGGKSPNIVFGDVDLASAAQVVAAASFFNSGQVCSAGSRLFIERAVYDDMLAEVHKVASSYSLGPALSAATTMGPLVDEQQRDRVERFVADGLSDGGRVVFGGSRPDGLDRGWFYAPTVFEGVDRNARLAREEVFGPVIVAEPFDSVDEVVARANDTEFGLAAGIHTYDLRKAQQVSRRVNAGAVFINSYNNFDASVPFGGYKQSGEGRDGGLEALNQYLQTKSVWTNYA
jgi:acyl-CoA reductase-like NAD-dependent aldehyde dehydrogenase